MKFDGFLRSPTTSSRSPVCKICKTQKLKNVETPANEMTNWESKNIYVVRKFHNSE